MIKTYKLSEIKLEDIFARNEETFENIEKIVSDIVFEVAKRGDAALFEYEEKFDKVSLSSLEVTEEEINEAFESTDAKFIETLKLAHKNISEFHKKQVRSGFSFSPADDILLGQKITPIEKVGIYVPGGTASYPSTVLMNAIPAKTAGVSEIVMVTPPGKDGKINPHVLSAAKIAGVDRIFKIGGAQAVAALAYGTETVPRVYKIVGPGNIFVATAKRQVFGRVSIDMIAGPSEILVCADKTANPSFVAADLLSQAEHDKMASAVLCTDSEELAEKVANEVELQLAKLPRYEIARESIDNNGKIIICDSIYQVIEAANFIAPEHLELCIENARDYLDLVKNAGSIFIGKNTPESLGDYMAGPNHTLPTSGTAKFSSPLSVDDFIKKSSFIEYSSRALCEIGDKIMDFAQREGLDAHANAVGVRMENQK